MSEFVPPTTEIRIGDIVDVYGDDERVRSGVITLLRPPNYAPFAGEGPDAPLEISRTISRDRPVVVTGAMELDKLARRMAASHHVTASMARTMLAAEAEAGPVQHPTLSADDLAIYDHREPDTE